MVVMTCITNENVYETLNVRCMLEILLRGYAGTQPQFPGQFTSSLLNTSRTGDADLRF